MKTVIERLLVIAVLGMASMQALATCFDEAASRYRVDPQLLRAIAQVESGGRPEAIGNNKTSKTIDIGLMQINSSWLTKEPFKSLGYQKEHLLDACTNVMVGAWVLAHNIKDFGSNWTAIGAYNASCRTMNKQRCQEVRYAYSAKVFREYQKLTK